MYPPIDEGVQAGTAVQPDSTLLPQQIRQLGHRNWSWPSLNGKHALFTGGLARILLCVGKDHLQV